MYHKFNICNFCICITQNNIMLADSIKDRVDSKKPRQEGLTYTIDKLEALDNPKHDQPLQRLKDKPFWMDKKQHKRVDIRTKGSSCYPDSSVVRDQRTKHHVICNHALHIIGVASELSVLPCFQGCPYCMKGRSLSKFLARICNLWGLQGK